jgi:hypothetical protein
MSQQGFCMTFRRLASSLAFLAVLSLPRAAVAQESIVTGLLTRAKNALNDLKYQEADSIARLIIVLGDVVPKPQRINALQIAAAARYPEDAPARKPDGALDALREIVKLGHTAPIPFEIGWVGLDSLYTQVGGTSQASTGNAPSSAGAGGGTGPGLQETTQWLLGRVPEFTGISWRDSTAMALSTATEAVTDFSIKGCTIRYQVLHREQDIWLKERNRKSAFKNDTIFIFEARSLDPATFENGGVDVAMRLFGMLRGSARSQVGFMRVNERPVAGKTRRLDWSFQTAAQASRVRNAMERLVELCAKEPF